MIRTVRGLILLYRKHSLKMFKIHKFSNVDSTNIKANSYPVGSVIVAKEQSKSYGRFKREWISSKGGLWFSIVVKPIRKICEYTFIASLAVFDVEIKWPNDIIYKGKKVCGILTEIISDGNKIKKAIIGIGLNVNNKVPEMGISLKEIKNKEMDLDKLLDRILENFQRIDKLELTTIFRLYKKQCSMLGKNIKVKTLNGEFEGKMVDIDNEGNLMLETKEGIIRLNEGDTSIL